MNPGRRRKSGPTKAQARWAARLAKVLAAAPPETAIYFDVGEQEFVVTHDTGIEFYDLSADARARAEVTSIPLTAVYFGVLG